MFRSASSKRFVTDVTSLSSSNLLSSIVRLIRGFIIIRLLTPELYGTFNLFTLILFYTKYSHLGYIHGAGRELMFATGRGDRERMRVIRNTAFTVVTALTGLIVVAIVLYAIFMVRDNLTRFGLFMVAVQTQLLRTYAFFDLEANIRKEFVFIGKLNLAASLVGTALAIGGTYFFNVYGLIASLVVTQGFQFVLLARKMRLGLGLGFNRHYAVRLLQIGFPIMLGSIAYWLLRTTDKTLIAMFMDRAALGLYSFAVFVNGFLMTAVDGLGQVLTPHFLQTYGRTGQVESMRRMFEQISRILAFAIPPLLGTVVLAVDYPVAMLLPRYTGSLDAIRVLVGSTFFMALAGPAGLVLVALNRQKLQAGMLWSALVIHIGINYLLIRSGYGIGGVAVGTLLAQAVSCILQQAVASSYYYPGVSKVRFFLPLYIPFVWAGVAVWIVWHSIGVGGADLWTTGFRLVVFWGTYCPILLWGIKSTKLFSYVPWRRVFIKVSEDTAL